MRIPVLSPYLRPLAALILLPLSACGGESASPGPGPAATGPTFHEDIEPILQKSCLTCHSPGRIAPFSLVKYEDAKPLAGVMASSTADRSMPPWGAVETDECQPPQPFKHDIRLSADEIATIDAWAKAGAPEGDPAKAPPPFELPPDDLSGKNAELVPGTPYVTSGDKDQFRCFVLDPQLAQTRYLNGAHIVPGNAKVVHHALVFLDRSGQSKQLADADGGYTCFGGPQVPAELVEAWAPGAFPFEFPPNVGTEVPAGSLFVMQIHYHPAGQTADPDATKVELRFTDTAPEYRTRFALIGNFKTFDANKNTGLLPGPDDTNGVEFRIPANKAGHTETMQYTVPATLGGKPVPQDLLVYGAGTHMHYVGTDMKISVAHAAPAAGEPKDECFVQTPKWDFNWQRTYSYDVPLASLPKVHPGDVLTFRCTYDNTLQNPFVAQALAEQGLKMPMDVTLGEQTLDEMCLGLLPLLIKQ
jgi:hypothetical protein